MDLYRQISKLPNYIHRFGRFHGVRLLIQIERKLPVKSEVVRQYILPDYAAPIFLRKTISDHAIFWQCLVRCHYDIRQFPQSERLLAAYRALAEKGVRCVIVDCGANIGLATVWFATQFPEATIYSVEPDNNNFEILQTNTACFGVRVTPLKGGIWHENSDLRIVNPESGSAALRVTASRRQSSVSIRAYTIDDICALAGIDSPFIVKIDIEGAQASLFRRNTDWVGKTHLIILELDDWLMPWQGTSRSFFSCISQYPFDYLIHGESLFCFRDFDATL